MPFLRNQFLLLIALVSGCREPSGQSSPPPQPPPDVSIVTVTPHPLVLQDVLPGRVVPERVAEVRPLVSGIVRERLFTEGDVVKAGQPLYRIDPTVFNAEVASASASTVRQRANVSAAEREAQRAIQLEKSGAIPSQQADTARSTLDVAKADLRVAEAMLARSRISLRYTTVTAPIAGRIGLSRVTEGALVSSADPMSMVTIQQLDQVYVDIRQPSTRYEELRERLARGELETSAGLPVTLVSMRGQPYEMEGRLLATDINVEPTTNELTLRVLVPNAKLQLLPGMFVRARIPVGREAAAITVPQQAVLRNPALGDSVMVVDKGDVVAVRSVTTGRVVEGQQVIRQGLAAGDRVIVEGQDRLGPGQAVHPSPWQVPPPPSAAPSASSSSGSSNSSNSTGTPPATPTATNKDR